MLLVDSATSPVSLAPYRSFEPLNAVSYFLMKNSGLPVALISGRLDWA
jgi:hypothetical protein